jgi:DNA-binding MarR family transcriptional regulator
MSPAPRARSNTFYRPENYRPEDSAAFMMKRIIESMRQEVDRELEPAGLTSAQWIPLLKIHMGQASAPVELARECQLDAGAMTRTLDRLEAKGLVRRVRSSEDRRVVNLELTDEGRAAARHIPTILSKVQNAHLRGFTHAEWDQLKALLQRILENAAALQAEREEGKA